MLQRIVLELLNIYQNYIRIMLPVSACRFSPTCSTYTQQAILRYGFLKGLIKATRRLLSCHPFSGKSGYYPLV